MLAEPDYQYGRGSLRLRVTRVYHDTSRWYGQDWVWLDGVEIRWNGDEGPPRRVLARASALPRRRS